MLRCHSQFLPSQPLLFPSAETFPFPYTVSKKHIIFELWMAVMTLVSHCVASPGAPKIQLLSNETDVFVCNICNCIFVLIGYSHFTSHSSVCQVRMIAVNFCSSVLYPLQTIYKCVEQYRSGTTLVSYWHSEDFFCYCVFLSLQSVILIIPCLL